MDENTFEQPIPPEEVEEGEVEEVEEVEESVKYDDGLSDLFATPKLDDPDMDFSDVVGVDMEEDIMDGDLSDLVEVTEEDIMGEDIHGMEDDDLSDLLDMPGRPVSTPESKPKLVKRYRIQPRGKQYLRELPPSLGEVQEDGR